MRSALILAAAPLLTLQPSPSPAQTADEFYKSNDITLVVATDVGGGYDLYARALAPYLKRHIASHSNVIVQNMPGAGDIRMANYMAANAKTDGSVIGLTLSPVVLNQLTQPAQVRYDANEFVWIGTIDAQTNVLFVAAAKAPVRSIEDARKTVVTIGATNANSFLYQEPAMTNALLATKFKIVSGYKGVKDINLAVERGEVDGQVSPWSTVKASFGIGCRPERSSILSPPVPPPTISPACRYWPSWSAMPGPSRWSLCWIQARFSGDRLPRRKARRPTVA